MRRFELVEGTSAKFWEVDTKKAVLVVRFGRIGTDGQTKEKSFATPAAAEAERDKLIREKTGKGYAEVSAGKAPPVKTKPDVKAKPDAKTKPGTKAKPDAKAKPDTTATTAVKAKPGTKATPDAKAKPDKKAKPDAKARPDDAKRSPLMPIPGSSGPAGKIAFTAALDELLARGWPHLRVLDDSPVSAAAARKTAIAALEAIDPLLPTMVSREVARRMLQGYLHHPFREGDAMRAAVDGDRQVDASLLADVLAIGIRKETYPYRMREVVYLLEAFLGTEVVLDALIERCRYALEETTKAWGRDKFSIDHDNSHWRRIIHAIGWLRLRTEPARWKSLVAPLRKANPKLPKYSNTLARLADDRVPVGKDVYSLDFAAQRRDRAAVRACVDVQPRQWWVHVEHVYVLGADWLLECDVTAGLRDPKWYQQRFVAEMGVLRAPGTLRAIGALLPSRSAGACAARWIEDHRAWVLDDALPYLEKRGRDPGITQAVRATLGGTTAPPEADEQALRRELAQMLAAVPPALTACEGDAGKELGVFKTAFARYCELQAALGEITPEAYFTHSFQGAKWGTQDRKVIARWIDLMIDAASP